MIPAGYKILKRKKLHIVFSEIYCENIPDGKMPCSSDTQESVTLIVLYCVMLNSGVLEQFHLTEFIFWPDHGTNWNNTLAQKTWNRLVFYHKIIKLTENINSYEYIRHISCSIIVVPPRLYTVVKENKLTYCAPEKAIFYREHDVLVLHVLLYMFLPSSLKGKRD